MREKKKKTRRWKIRQKDGKEEDSESDTIEMWKVIKRVKTKRTRNNTRERDSGLENFQREENGGLPQS